MTESGFRPRGLDFDAVYRGETALTRAPWEIGKPQPAFVELEAAGYIRGSVLDAGCGTGENALHLAAKGYPTTGIDLSPAAIDRARRKAGERSITATFEVANALEIVGYDNQFDSVIDCGLAHVFDAANLKRYAGVLHRVCRGEAVVHILAVSDRGMTAPAAPGSSVHTAGITQLRRMSPHKTTRELRAGFADGWMADALDGAKLHAVLPFTADPIEIHAWLARFRRIEV